MGTSINPVRHLDVVVRPLLEVVREMRATAIRLAKGFGELPLTGGVGVRGVTKYSLSPFEQKAFAGFLGKGIPNTLRRIKSEFFYVVPPFAIGYLIYDWGEREHERLQRKQPGQFDHET